MLPSQWDLLEKYPKYIAISRVGFANMLLQDGFKEIITLYDKQKARLQDKAKELRERLIKDVKELELKALEELLCELPSRERKQLIDFYQRFEKKESNSIGRFIDSLGNPNGGCLGCEPLSEKGSVQAYVKLPESKSVLENKDTIK